MEALLLALVGPLTKLIENALSDNYDKEAELESILKLQRVLMDERARRALLRG